MLGTYVVVVVVFATFIFKLPEVRYWALLHFFDGNIRIFCRIGSNPFLWWILKTWEKARYRNVIEPFPVRFSCRMSCASISCAISAKRPNRFIFTSARNLVWNFVRESRVEFRPESRIVPFVLAHATFRANQHLPPFPARTSHALLPRCPSLESARATPPRLKIT